MKAVSPAVVYSKKIDPNVDAFYTKFVRNKYYVATKSNPSPVFVDVGDFPVTYEHFQASFKPRAYIANEVMAVFVQNVNVNAKELVGVKSNCRKHSFSPYLASKLIKEPADFDKIKCAREISRISSEVNLSNIDLMHFPIMGSGRGALACVNNLFSTVNYFDSARTSSKNREEDILRNLVSNLQSVFEELNIGCKNFQEFKRFIPPDYPKQRSAFDCALYVMMYMEHWKGKVMKDFSNVLLPKFRMTTTYKIFHFEHNKINSEPVVASKKRRLM